MDTCNVSDEAFTDLDSLTVQHTDTKPYLCKVCGGTLMDADNLTTHKEEQKERKPYLCNMCDEAFTDLDSLIVHKEEHRKESLYACAECKKIFTTEGELERHLETHRSISSTKLNTDESFDFKSIFASKEEFLNSENDCGEMLENLTDPWNQCSHDILPKNEDRDANAKTRPGGDKYLTSQSANEQLQ